jgi:predicted RNA-binding protein YlqC (UPF0109 family)
MEDLIRFITESIVEYPNDIKIIRKDCENEEENKICFELSVHKDDLGKIIGKKGRTVKAIRTLLNAASMKQNKKFVLEISD